MILEGLFSFDGFMGSKMDLMRDKDIAGSMINEDGAAGILLFLLFFAVGCWKSSTGGAYKMID